MTNETQEQLMCDEIPGQIGEVWLEKISNNEFLRAKVKAQTRLSVVGGGANAASGSKCTSSLVPKWIRHLGTGICLSIWPQATALSSRRPMKQTQ